MLQQIADERSQREVADNRLSQRINVEATLREEADIRLHERADGIESALVQEIDTRTRRDNALAAEIVAEKNRAESAEQAIRDSIPTVNDGVLTIIQNGETVGTFSANQSANTEIRLKAGESIVNVDGGSASSVYLFDQIIDGGNA